MRKTKTKGITSENQILVDTEGLKKMLSCGRPVAVDIGTKAKARVQSGRRVFWNVKKVQRYLDEVSE